MRIILWLLLAMAIAYASGEVWERGDYLFFAFLMLLYVICLLRAIKAIFHRTNETKD